MSAGPRTSRAVLPVAGVAAALAFVPVLVGDSRTSMGVAVAILTVAGYAVGLNVAFGLTKQLLLCVGALGGVAGYTTVVLADDLGWPLVAALVVGVAGAAALGAVFTWLAVRRSLDVIFTGILTLTFALGFESLVLGQRAVTGGEDGRRLDAADGTLLSDPVGGYYVVLVVLAVCLLGYQLLDRSHHGRAYRALRDDETAAALAGVDVGRHRVQAGAIGAAMIGLVGGAHALVEGLVAPASYSFLTVDVTVLVALAIGGIGHVLAPVVGAVFYGLLDEWVLRELGTLRTAVQGVVLVTLFLVLRDGLTGSAVSLVSARAGRRRRRDAPDAGGSRPGRGQRE